ncbi:hypothetical protein JHW43_008355 [Diplocarpon mali]|nr:hypothetical protein JHW43_008355 [Diplocarpon mali]
MDSASTSSSGNRLFGDTKTENTSKQTTENAGLVISAGDKKPSRTKAKGSRIAANLTTDQLARKRAADRNAQQSMRQRTRDHIHDLEARFKELKRQQALLEVAEKRTGKLETESQAQEPLGSTLPKAHISNFGPDSAEKRFDLDVVTAGLYPLRQQLKRNPPPGSRASIAIAQEPSVITEFCSATFTEPITPISYFHPDFVHETAKREGFKANDLGKFYSFGFKYPNTNSRVAPELSHLTFKYNPSNSEISTSVLS